jgi:hypothetical protein
MLMAIPVTRQDLSRFLLFEKIPIGYLWPRACHAHVCVKGEGRKHHHHCMLLALSSAKAKRAIVILDSLDCVGIFRV